MRQTTKQQRVLSGTGRKIRRQITLALGLILASFFAAAPAQAVEDTWIDFSDDYTLSSPVSGKASSDTEEYEGHYNFTTDIKKTSALFGIIVDEQNNKPCKIEFFSRKFDYQSGFSTSFKRCGSASGPTAMARDLPKVVLGKLLKKEMAMLPKDHFITAVQVCKARKKDRVKGIRVYGHIAREGQIRGGAKRDEYKLPNCYRWLKSSRCPEGQAATGATAHFREEGRNDSLIGLQLHCRPLVQIIPE